MSQTHSSTTPKLITLGITVPFWTLFAPVLIVTFLILIDTQRPDQRLHLWVLDVGEGDSILLRTPQGHTALIDGGPGATPVLNGIGAHIPFWQHNLDLIVLTVPRQDHMMALPDVLKRYQVEQIVQTQFTATVGVQGAWLEAIGQKHVPVHYAKQGEKISFDGEPDISLRVLSPTSPEGKSSDANTSIALRLEYGNSRILLESDAQIEAERRLVADEPGQLGAQVLKISSQGSKTSSSRPFLDLVHPRVAIISVGAGNRFGHPAPETLQALQDVGAKVYRTDLNGTVEVIADKEHIWLRTDR
jgi:competence protein ComEC